MRDRLYCPSLLLLAVVSATSVFAFDYSLPLGVASGMPYVVLVLLSFITRRVRDVILLATLGTLLTIAGYYVSVPGGVHYMVLINRGLVLLAIWSVALVLICHFSTLVKLDRQATLDQVTGLYNRHWFFAKGNELIHNWRRYRTPLSLIMFDLDDFKQVNDQYGHEAGDRVLRAIASVCQECVRDTDIAARIGGEEFAILMPSTTVNGARVIASRIQDQITSMSVWERGQSIKVTVSIGIAQLEDASWELSDLLRCVDKLLYEAKGQGKNRIVFAQPTLGPQNIYLDSLVF